MGKILGFDLNVSLPVIWTSPSRLCCLEQGVQTGWRGGWPPTWTEEISWEGVTGSSSCLQSGYRRHLNPDWCNSWPTTERMRL